MPATGRGAGALALTCLLLVPALACAGDDGDGFDAVPAVARPAGSLSWSGCDDLDGDRVECATLPVPLAGDRARTIELELARRRADDDQRLGVLLVNPGGPGVPARPLVTIADGYFDDRILDRFDLVAWDPRGTGSDHAIDCVDDLDAVFSHDPAPDGDDELAALTGAIEAFVAGCEERSGDLLGAVTTTATARDIDAIRAALGEEQVSFFGFSYGSELGATYATLHPDRVRAMVLDGALSPELDSMGITEAQARGTNDAFEAFLDWCADDDCAFHGGGDPSGAFDALAARLDDEPLLVDEARPAVGPAVLWYAVVQALYDSSFWDVLAEGLADAEDGDGARLLALYDTYVGRDDDGEWSDLLEASVAIRCADEPAPRELAAYERQHERLRQIAPRVADAFSFGITCALWPVEAQPTPPVDTTGAPPIVVIGTTGDPYTPYEASRELAEQLAAAVFVTFDAEGHTAYTQGTDCLRDAVDRYLVELTVPPDGLRCEA